MKTLVVIPAYNEQESIVPFVLELKQICPDVDYIIINDCSKDNTLLLCQQHKFPVLNLPVNLGIGGAVQTGYRYAQENGYDIVVQMDGDGQHDPHDLLCLLEAIQRGDSDIVIGSRFLNRDGFQSTITRRIGICILRFAIYLRTKCHIADPTSGFRAVNRQVIQFFSSVYAQDYPEPESIVAAVKKGFRIQSVSVKMRKRASGESSISRLKSIYYMLKVTLAVLLYTPKK